MELYVDRDSWLHRLDPRTKLAFALAGAALLLATSNLWVILAWLAATHALLLTGRVPGARLRWAWQATLPVLIMVPLLWPLFYHEGPTLLELGPLRVAGLSLVRGLAVGLRIAALAFVWFVLLFTTDQARLVRGLVRLGLPYSWGLAFAIALRYLPAIQQTYVAVAEAQQARGLVLGRGHFLAAARAQLPILVAVLIGALRTTDQLALALQARAYSPRQPRTSYRELRLTRLDAALLLGIAALTVAYLAARLGAGFAAHPLQPW